MNKEYLEALEWLLANEMIYRGRTRLPISPALIEIKQRLESIDNAKPSEAMECLDNLGNSLSLANELLKVTDTSAMDKYITTIKQALLKAQKEHNSVNLLMQELDCKDFADLRKYARCGYEKLNKQYLKWEDLEFSFKDKYMKVKLNGNIYTLRYTRNALMEFPVAYMEFDNTEITIIDCKKQFFNDLHLERVEE